MSQKFVLPGEKWWNWHRPRQLQLTLFSSRYFFNTKVCYCLYKSSFTLQWLHCFLIRVCSLSEMHYNQITSFPVVKFYLLSLEDFICPTGILISLIWSHSSNRGSETACLLWAHPASPSHPCTHENLSRIPYQHFLSPASCLLWRIIDSSIVPQTHFMGHKVYFCSQLCDSNAFIT